MAQPRINWDTMVEAVKVELDRLPNTSTAIPETPGHQALTLESRNDDDQYRLSDFASTKSCLSTTISHSQLRLKKKYKMATSRAVSSTLRTLAKTSKLESPSCSLRAFPGSVARRQLSHSAPRRASFFSGQTLLTSSARHSHHSTAQERPMQCTCLL